MAHTVSFTTVPRNVASVLLAPFRVIGGFMIALAEASPKMQALTRLNTLSDADLAAKGLTRDGEIRRIVGSGY